MSNIPTRRVEICRKDDAVVLIVNCTDDYEAMLLYDEMSAEIANGYLMIELDHAVVKGGSES